MKYCKKKIGILLFLAALFSMPAYGETRTWTGTSGTDWGQPANWNGFTVPGVGDDVTIPAGKPNYPKLTAAPIAKAKTVKIEAGAELDLAAYIIETTGGVTAKLDNCGKLQLTGTAQQKAWFENSNTANKLSLLENTTVVYYGTSSNAIYKGPYYNLTIQDTKTISSGATLNVTNDFTINGDITLSSNMYTKNCTIESGEKLTANADITLSGDFTADGEFVPNNKTVKFTGTNSKVKGTAVRTVFYNMEVNSGSLTVERIISVNNDFRANSTTTLKKYITVQQTFVVNAQVQLTDDATLSSKNITIASTSKLDANGNIILRGDFENNGTFIHRNKTVDCKGHPAKISGNSTDMEFYNLKVTQGILNIDRKLTAKNITINNTCRINANADITLSGDFTNHGIFVHGSKKVIFNGNDTKINGSMASQFYDLQVTHGASLTTSSLPLISVNSNLINDGTFTINTDITVSGSFVNNGTFTHNDKAVRFNGSNAKIAGTSPETQFYDLEVVSGILKLLTPITLTNSFKNTGQFKANNNRVILNNTSDITIIGTNNASDTEFYELSMKRAGGKKLELQNKITVKNHLYLTGSNINSMLEISGNGSINLTSATNNGEYLSIDSINVHVQTTNYAVKNSKKTDGTRPVNQIENGWLFASIDFIWQGSDNDWNNLSNWNFVTIPAAYDIVTISTKPNYPKLTGTTNAKAKSVKIESGAELNLADYIIETTGSATARLRNEGTLQLTGTPNQKTWFENSTSANKIELAGTGSITGTSSAVYYGTSSNSIYKGPYYDVTMTNKANLDFPISSTTPLNISSDNPITVSHNLTITGIVTLNKELKAGNVSIASTGHITASADITVIGDFTNDGTFTHGNKKVTFDGSDAKIKGSAISRFYDLELPATKQLTLDNEIEVDHDFTNNGTFIHGSKKVTFNGTDSKIKGSAVSQFYDLELPATKQLTLDNEIEVEHDFTNNGTFVHGSKKVTFNGTDSKIKGSAVSQFYDLELPATKQLTLDNEIEVEHNFTNNGTFVHGSKKVTFNGSDTKITGSAVSGFYNLQIMSDKKLTLEKDIKIENEFTNNGEFVHGNNAVIFNGNDTKIMGSKSIQFYDLKINSGKLTLEKDIVIKNDFTNIGTFNHNYKTVFFYGNNAKINGTPFGTEFYNLQITTSGELTLNTDIKIRGMFKNENIFTHNNKKVTFNGRNTKISGTSVSGFYNLEIVQNKKLTLEKDIKIENEFTNNGKFVHGNNSVIFNGTNTKINGLTESRFYNLRIDAHKKLTLEKNIKIENILNNEGTFDAAANSKTVTLSATTADIIITGTSNTADTKFYKLKMENSGGKTLTVINKISVTNNLSLSGSGTANFLTVKGTNGEIYLTVNNDGEGNYLHIDTDAVKMTNKVYKVFNSLKWEHERPSPQNQNNWVFEPMTITWTAEEPSDGDKTEWDKYRNWDCKAVPSVYDTVTIPAGKLKYPKLTGTTNAKAKEVTVDEGAELNLTGETIATDSGNAKVIMKGTLKLTGTAQQKAWFKNPNDANKLSLSGNTTVVYYGTADADIYNGTYYNLTIQDTKTISSDAALNVTNNFTINGDITLNKELLTKNSIINTGGKFTANTGITVSGDFTNDGEFEPADKTVTFTGTDSKLQGNSLSKFYNLVIASGKLTITQQIAVLHNFTANSTAEVNAACTVDNDFAVNAAVKLNGNLTSKNIIINASKTLTANADITLTGNLTNNGTFSHADDKNVIFNGTSAQKIDGGVPFTEFYNLKTVSGVLTVNQNIKTRNNFIADAVVNTTKKAEVGNDFFVNDDVTLGDEFTSKNITIAASKTLISNANITITGNLANSGTFNANAIMTLKGNFTNTGKFKSISDTNLVFSGDKITIAGGDNEADTEFNNLICNGAKNKKLIFSRRIKVPGNLKLAGTTEGHLVIDGLNNAAIYLNEYQTDNAHYLQINTSTIKINDGKFNIYYIVKNSVDNLNEQRNKNGWVFDKTFAIENSFIRANDNKIYLLIPAKMYENEFTYSKLIVTDTVTHSVIASGSTSQPYTAHTFTDASPRTVWEYTLNKTISADTILNKNIRIELEYFNKTFSKKYISDIGIDIIKVLFAASSKTIRDFTGKADLPKLNTTIPISSLASSKNIRLYFDYNKNTFWYPYDVIKNSFSSNPITVDIEGITTAEEFNGIEENGSLKFIIPSDTPNFKTASVAEFMFVYDGWLPCANLKSSSDPLSFDVWKFNVVGVSSQRGGVSIYNNVINTNKDEKVSIQLTLQKSGIVTIQIMTIDGSIVKTIERSHKTAGTHFYEWDGKNNAGNYIARGLYFIRIAAPDIDEIRKVMIIKD